MKTLFESFQIRNTTVKNRLVLPPMVTYSGDEAGQPRVDHYRRIAAGGMGLVIVEATCVADGGQLGTGQIGIWDDRHIDGLKQIADAIHAGGAAALIQIHHAGVVGVYSHLCPDTYRLNHDITGEKLSIPQIEELTESYIRAGERAFSAGFDGVELHGCHSYLICQFMNRRVNRRDDIYGAHPEKFPADILNGIRARTGENFIVGIRMGGFEPALDDGIRNAKLFETAGFDFLDVSYGFGQEQDIDVPADFPLKDIIYAAGEVKKQVSIPVFAVNSIRTGAQAQLALELTDVDGIDIGRACLVDPAWANKVQANEAPIPCLSCKRCHWGPDGSRCAGKLLAQRQAK